MGANRQAICCWRSVISATRSGGGGVGLPKGDRSGYLPEPGQPASAGTEGPGEFLLQVHVRCRRKSTFFVAIEE